MYRKASIHLAVPLIGRPGFVTNIAYVQIDSVTYTPSEEERITSVVKCWMSLDVVRDPAGLSLLMGWKVQEIHVKYVGST